MHIKTAHGYTTMEWALNWPVSNNESDFETRAAMKAQMVTLFQQFRYSIDGKLPDPKILPNADQLLCVMDSPHIGLESYSAGK